MRLAAIVAVLVASAAGAGAAVTLTPRQAEAFAEKLASVLARGDAAPSGQRTEFSNDELNAYLQLRLAPTFPPGVTEPSLTLVGQGRVSGRATVDLDGIRQRSSGGWFDLAAYLGGRLPVTAVGTLKSGSGSAQFVLERADISGVPMPKAILQELVSYYTSSPDLPAGVGLDAPFTLPAGIQRIDVNEGRAVVVQ